MFGVKGWRSLYGPKDSKQQSHNVVGGKAPGKDSDSIDAAVQAEDKNEAMAEESAEEVEAEDLDGDFEQP